MNAFADDYLFYVLFVGLCQALFAAVVAVTVVPFLSRVTRRRYRSLLRYFALLNVYLLVWGGLGNSIWLHFTANRLSVADDCPVWAPFVPFSRWVLDSAVGWSGGWQLHGGTTIGQLQWLWVAIAVSVWVSSIFSVSASRALLPEHTNSNKPTHE